MRKVLPARPNIEHLKSQAKDLLSEYRRGESAAFERLRDALPSARGSDDARLLAMNLALHDAQSAVAREYGFESWNELRAGVERRSESGLSEDALRALMGQHGKQPMPAEVMAALMKVANEPKGAPISLPSTLPVVPVRNALLAAGSAAPLNIGRPSSLAAVEAARAGDGVLAMFAQRNEMTETPSESDLHATGCVVRLVNVVPVDERGLWIVVRADRWIRLESIEKREPFLAARVSEFTVHDDDAEETRRLHQTLGGRVHALVATLPDAEKLGEMTEAMSAAELADTAIANLECSVDDKARYAGEPRLTERLRIVLEIMERPSG